MRRDFPHLQFLANFFSEFTNQYMVHHFILILDVGFTSKYKGYNLSVINLVSFDAQESIAELALYILV